MSALTDLDSQVNLAEKAVADLKMRAQQLMNTSDTTSNNGNSASQLGLGSGGPFPGGSGADDPMSLGLGSGGPAPREGGGLIVVNNVNTELGIGTNSVGDSSSNDQFGPIDIKYPTDPLANDGPTTSNGTSLTDETKGPKATIMVEAPNNKMRNILVLVVLAFGAYMVFRKK